jgi:hypothetical protein
MAGTEVLGPLQHMNSVKRVFFRRHPFKIARAVIGGIAILVVDVVSSFNPRDKRLSDKFVDLSRESFSVLMKHYQGIVVAAYFRIGIVGGSQEFPAVDSAHAPNVGYRIVFFKSRYRSPIFIRQVRLGYQRPQASLFTQLLALGRLGVIAKFSLPVFADSAEAVKPTRDRWIFREFGQQLVSLARRTVFVAYSGFSHDVNLQDRFTDWIGSLGCFRTLASRFYFTTRGEVVHLV